VSTGELLLFSGLGAIYVALVITLGITTRRNGHTWLFWLGFFVPALWLWGAITKSSTR
jgi:hypothetical protein